MQIGKDSIFHQVGEVDQPIPVAEYIEFLNENLRRFYASIIGEVGQVSKSSRGHVYFSLKDQNKESVIYCVIWKGNYELYGVELEDGMEIVATGCPDIYEPTGRLTFKADAIEIVGEGALRKAYEELKKKLAGEGIFDIDKKRPIPDYPNRIGVITSIRGAVIHDFINNLGKYGFHVKIMDSRVEGQQAVKELLLSMKSFRKQDIDALVIIRGGGSLESLMAFNNEALVREVSSFPVPVIAGIGHHLDVPLVSLAVDAMESTPTATANLLNKSWEQAENTIEKYQRDILEQYSYALKETQMRLEETISGVQGGLNLIFDFYRELEQTLKTSIAKVRYSILMNRKIIKDVVVSIKRGFLRSVMTLDDYITGIWRISLPPDFISQLSFISQKLDFFENTVRLNDPARQLRLGYSITRHKGKVVRGIRDVQIGASLNTQVSDGVIDSKVKGVHKNEQKD
ncbi:MAG TPA: exodeoxyribonuclease VII large subunit [Thermodesulfobacteriota bacterium]